MRLSVLDLVPVRSGQSSAQAVAASLALVRLADELGLHRYWFAEHHNMPAVASTTPPVLAAAAAAVSERIRIGSGGVMLPNHAPLIVAEQFAALEALAPGRIDLGIGRAPGSDPIITALLRQSGTAGNVDEFPSQITDILALVRPGGATLRLAAGRDYAIAATPSATSVPELWLLGSSEYSARLAAKLGLPYVFANHFAGVGLENAIELYRREYTPSEMPPGPVTFLTLNVSVDEDATRARELALPQARSFAKIRTNRPPAAAETIEQVLAAEPDPTLDPLTDDVLSRWVVGEPDAAAAQIRELAARHDVDEVMISPAGGASESDPLDRVPARESTLRLLADRLLG